MKDESKFQIRRFRIFLESAIPYVIIMSVIGFGLWGIGIQRDTRRAAENTEQIIIQLETGVNEITCLLTAHELGIFDATQCIDMEH